MCSMNSASTSRIAGVPCQAARVRAMPISTSLNSACSASGQGLSACSRHGSIGLPPRDPPAAAAQIAQRDRGLALDQHRHVVPRPIGLAIGPAPARIVIEMLGRVPAIAGHVDSAAKPPCDRRSPRSSGDGCSRADARHRAGTGSSRRDTSGSDRSPSCPAAQKPIAATFQRSTRTCNCGRRRTSQTMNPPSRAG